MDTAVRTLPMRTQPIETEALDQPPTLLDWGDFTEGSGYQTPPAPPPHA